jgi:hypothetical protein
MPGPGTLKWAGNLPTQIDSNVDFVAAMTAPDFYGTL